MQRTAPPWLIIGTAGHIDHGKTSLIRALTGVDTDRLAEEKRRGISIDLGFAHMTLPSGRVASFVDVPGHERFVKNMLAGATGIQAVLLVVAADESVMPQTREHFEICRLLGVSAGIIVLTKVDLATEEQITNASSAVRALCADSFLADAPIVPVSALTGAGLADLQTQLDALESAAPSADGTIARLPVDRSFSLKGFGTVVTGTLTGEPLSMGGQLFLHPGPKTVRVRGVQVHGRAVEQAMPGQRTAINLSGIESHDIERGFVLTTSNIIEPSRWLGVSLTWIAGETPPVGRQQVLFHAGAAEIVAHLKMLGDGLGRLSLASPLLVFPGDRFILRRPSPAATIAGGIVVDPSLKLRVRRTRAIERLQFLKEATLAQRLDFLVSESDHGRTLMELVRLTGRPIANVQATVQAHTGLLLDPTSGYVVSRGWLSDRRKGLLDFLQRFHAQNPGKAGAPLSAARLGLEPTLAHLVLSGIETIRVRGDTVALRDHRAAFTQIELVALARIESTFQKAGFAPPAPAEVLKTVNLDAQKSRPLLEALVKNNRLVRVSPDLLFHVDVIAHIRAALVKHKGRRFSIPEFKDWTQISRKYAIPLLEYLDHQRVTRREGDSRIVL